MVKRIRRSPSVSARRKAKHLSKTKFVRVRGDIAGYVPAVAAHWTRGQTVAANYRNLGLVSDPNAVDKDTTSGTQSGAAADVATDLLRIERTRLVGASVARLSVNERSTIRRLLERYGADTRRMARDTTLNAHQLTERQLVKRIAIYERTLSDH